MIELEKKLLLTEKEYHLLLDRFCGGLSSFVQVNYYFDTNEYSMNQKGITCRIRCKNGELKATMKAHHAVPGGSVEAETTITNGLKQNGFTDMGLLLQGFLTTCRTVLFKNDLCEMVLDKNEYLGHTDYELEIEYKKDCEPQADEMVKKITTILMKSDPETTPQRIALRMHCTQSKSQRFFGKLFSGFDIRCHS